MFLGHEEITPLLIKYNLKLNIYMKNEIFRNNRWITINEQGTGGSIYVTYKGEKNTQDKSGHYNAYINPAIDRSKERNIILRIIGEQSNEERNDVEMVNNEALENNRILSKINILLWNAKSLNPKNDCTKKNFLIRQNYDSPNTRNNVNKYR